MFDLLFESAHYTLLTLGRDPKWLGGQLGIISMHTHGQELSFHPHIHCIVSGGGINKDGQWQTNKRAGDSFLFHVG
ncbi:MAG: transposase [Saprospiraceae bacterium]|nr:transposase [Candidatus Parvibacillus calidus]